MKRFRHLDVPNHWEHYWSKYPEGYTVLEALLNWVRQVNDMTDTQNSLSETVEEYRKELDDFVEQFDDNLRSEVSIMLNDWYASGLLAEIINKEVFDMKADTVDLEALSEDVGPMERLGDSYRSITETISEHAVNALDFGVKGDGVTDDTLAIQEFITYCEDNNKTAFFPSNVYYVPGNIKTRNQNSYHYVPGLTIKGSGKTTIFKGSGAEPVNYQSNLDDQAMFSIYSNNNIITDISFEGVKAPFYFGQDKRSEISTHSSFNIIERIWMTYVGTGFLIEPSRGFYYNKVRDIHIAHFQTGVHMMESSATTQPNANRNIFEGFRLTRGWLGFYVIGDGNTFIGCFGENIKGNQATGHRPYHLPDVEPITGLGGMYYFHGTGTNNRVIGGSNENVTFDVYDVGYKNQYIGNRFDDTSTAPQVHFPDPARSPAVYIGQVNKFGILETATNSPGIWGTPPGVYVDNGRLFDKGYYRTRYRPENHSPDIFKVNSNSRSYASKLGRILKWTASIRFELPADFDSTQPVRLTLPFEGKLELEAPYTAPTYAQPMLIPGIWATPTGGLSSFEVAKAYFDTSGTSPVLVVHPPRAGWRTDTNTNGIQFDLNINVDEI